MNESQIIPIIVDNLDIEKEKKEESFEEYQIIKEDYCSSPKCGIKSKIVTKSVEKIIFSPVEISTKPYFKYCVTPGKDEHFKYDFSQSETNHTRNQEDKNQKKNINNISYYQKNSYLDFNKDGLKEEKNENDCENVIIEESETISKYLNIIEKKENDLNFNDNNDDNLAYNEDNNEKKKIRLRNKNKHKNKTVSVSLLKNIQNIQNNNFRNKHDSISILKGKRKLSDNDNTFENNKEKKKVKNSQKNIHKFILNDDNSNNKILETETTNYRKNKSKTNSIFQSIKLVKDNAKNGNKFSPFRIVKDKKEPIKIITSRTSTNINVFKKNKKSQEGIKKTKTFYFMNEPLTSNKKSKEIKEKIQKIILDNNDDSEENNKKDSNTSNSNNNFISNKKKKSKHLKIKNLKEKEIFSKKKENLKKNENERKNFSRGDTIGKRKTNNNITYKIKIDEKFKNDINLFETPKNRKKRRGTMFDFFNFDSKKKNNILKSIKKEKENGQNIKTSDLSSFCDNAGSEIKKSRDKDKEKENTKSKEKEKENNHNFKRTKTKEKKEKKKSKKKEKTKIKEKDLTKDNKYKKKYSANNLKLISIKSPKESKNDSLIRREKSKTIMGNFHNGIINRASTKNINIMKYTTKNNYSNKNIYKRMNTRESMKVGLQLNLGYSQKFARCGRRNSTRVINNIYHEERITEYTNKQNIENINEYTKLCLEIIPDLYKLKEIPRCKTKVHPTLKKSKNKKKIVLFDLDETLVHCIGEINMNNVESFSRQCDAKIKVLLPGGKQVTVGINIRPHWEEALNLIKEKYHIIAYTASHESYADSVINYLDPENKYFEYRLYRSHCVLCSVNDMKFYVKDLGILDEFCDLKNVVLIDNSVLSFAYHLDNGIPISPFYDSKNDCELLDISNLLFKYADEDDIRNKLREVYKLSEYLEIIKNNISEESFTGSDTISIVQEDEEGERTNKNCKNNKNKISFTMMSKTGENKNVEDYNEGDNNNKNINKIKNIISSLFRKSKNNSQKNLKCKDIINLFEKINLNNNKRGRSFTFKEKNTKKLDSKKIYDIMNNSKIVNRSFGIKKKKKFRSFRSIDINFKKEWDEKQKQLNIK